MNLAQTINALPLQVYIRRGELVIHFSTPADLVSRLAETSVALAELERQGDPSRPDPKAERGGRRARRRARRPLTQNARPPRANAIRSPAMK